MVLLLVVDDRLLELAREDVARHAHRQVRLLEDHLRRGVSFPRCWSTSCSLCRYLISRSKSSRLRPARGGPHDHAAVADVDLLRGTPHAVALLVVEPARHADALALRHVHQVAPAIESCIESRGPFVFSGSLIAWTRISWPGLSSSVMRLPLVRHGRRGRVA